jgi:energy-coupling factor transporter ATP-binding protein EcfA2
MNNPFSLDFGTEPNLYIPRTEEQNKIINTFNSEMPSTHMYLLLGARGSGKTVLMTAVSHRLAEDKKWLHIDLNVETDMLNSLAANLYKKTQGKFPKVKFDVSIKGVSISLDKDEKYSDIQLDIDSMLKTLAKHDIKVLITIDEVINSKNVREFTTYYQHCLREKLPVFVLMTGLYKNVRALQNNRSQTFLKRAPKVSLSALNMRRMAKQYEEIFGIGEAESFEMAKLTDGYSYGFQILGYYLFESKKKVVDDKILFEYKTSLEESSYEKIWEELSPAEQKVSGAISGFEDNVSVKTVRESIQMDSNNFSSYQSTLENSGILKSDGAYGRLCFALPFFKEFVQHQTI